MGVSVKALGQNLTPEELVPVLKDILQDLEEQLNQRANIYVSTDGRVPTNLQKNDLLIVAFKGTISIYVKTSQSFLQLNVGMLGGMPAAGTTFKGFISKSGVVALADFPNANDWGFYTNTAGPTTFLVANFAGAIKKIAMT